MTIIWCELKIKAAEMLMDSKQITNSPAVYKYLTIDSNLSTNLRFNGTQGVH